VYYINLYEHISHLLINPIATKPIFAIYQPILTIDILIVARDLPLLTIEMPVNVNYQLIVPIDLTIITIDQPILTIDPLKPFKNRN
jgi:hypothetical protein